MSSSRHKKRRLPDTSHSNPKKRIKRNKCMNKKETQIKWKCNQIWNYDQNGGIYSMKKLNAAKAFYQEQGFSVIKNVLNESQNKQGKHLLLSDLKYMNNGRMNHINNINDIKEHHLSGWKQTGQRVEFGISGGSFANFSRLNENVYKIFEIFHGTKDALCSSLDCVGITINNTKNGELMWLHCDQSLYSYKHIHKNENGYDYHNIQSSLYYTESNEYTVSFVIVPKSHNLYWNHISDKLAKHNIKPLRKHWMGLKQLLSVDDMFVNNMMDTAYRIHCPSNALIIWNSKCIHQNCNAIKQCDMKGLSRICQFISFCPNKLREKEAFKTTLCMAINGTTSTQWAQFMFPSSMKHPRFMNNKNIQHFKDIKPKKNPEIDEECFKRMIPNSLKNCKVKMYGDEQQNEKELTLNTVHCLTLTQLKKFKIKDLYTLIHPDLKAIQPLVAFK